MSREYGSRGAYRALAAIFRFIHYESKWQRPEQHWNWEASLRGTHSGRGVCCRIGYKKNVASWLIFLKNQFFLWGGG